MERIKLIGTESYEINNVFKFDDGEVRVVEREVHEFYGPERSGSTRLVIGNAIERTRDFIAKSRAEISDLNAVLHELTAK